MHFIYYYLISLSIVGYGLLINQSFNIRSKNLGIIGFIGIFFLIFISYISTFFIAHDYNFNLIVLVGGLLLSIYFFSKNKISKKNIKFFFLVFSILFIFILVGKNHDDFGYYHFPYTHILTQEYHPFGLGQINNGFRNQSSLFFLNSLFYLPKIDIYFYHVGAVFFLGFANLFFLKNIFDQKNFLNFRFFNLINLFFLIFINIFFSRLAEYGTDRIGSILIILSFIVILFIINNNSKLLLDKNDELIKFLLIIGSIAISMKPFYIIYFTLLFFLIFYSHLRNHFIKILKTNLFIIIVIFTFFTFFISFINSGCFIFPAKFTCLENFAWSISKNEVQEIKIWYELWSKGGANPNFIVEQREDYISNLNWLDNWIKIYFFNKMSDYLASILLLSLILYFTFRSKIKIKTIGRKYFIVIIFLLFYLIEWFFFHPSLRYGGYHLFILLLFIPLVFYLENFKLNWSLFKKKSITFILITVIIFLGRNVYRLDKEYELYNYNVFQNMNYKFIGGDRNFYLRYDKKINKKDFNYEYKYFFGKKILVIKK